MWILLVRPACMAILTGLWHRLSSSLLWVCLSLFLLRGVARPVQGLGSISWCRRDLCQGLVVLPWIRGLTWRVGMRLIQVARSLLMAMSPPVLLTLGGKGSMGVGTPDVSWSSASLSSWSAVFQVGMLFKFFDQWRSITSNRFVFNMVQGHHLQLWSHPPLSHNFQQFNVKTATIHHPIIQKEVDKLPDMSGSLFSMVIMLSPLIYRMLIYIFLLLSIIIVSYDLFGTMCLISGKFCLLGWPQPLRFSLPWLNLFCSFSITRVLLSIWMTSWS